MQSKKQNLISKALKLSIIGYGCVLLVCSLLILSYFFGVEWIYRPVANGPATHPLTTIMLLVLSLTGVLIRTLTKWAGFLLVFVGVCLVTRLQQELTGNNIIDEVLSLNATFSHLLSMSSPMKMGSNTTYMLSSIFIALVFMLRQRFCYLTQVIAIFSIFLPLLSVVGYLYNVENFHGQMSPTTTVLGMVLSISTICLESNKGIVHALLAPTFGARIVRWQLIVGGGIFLVGGYTITHIQEQEKAIALYVALVCFCFILIMLVSAVSYERYDKQRRTLEEELSVSAITDRLTNVNNRMALDKDMSLLVNKRPEQKKEISVLLIDVDHFKTFNDTYGHLVGDNVLKTVAQTLKANIRTTDAVYRYGGEEFVVVLLQCELHKAAQIAEKLRKKVCEKNLSPILEVTSHTHISVSIGCSSLSQANSADEVFKLADKALYTAKENGRNQVCIGEAINKCQFGT
ncbi:GGDEF domain-containing protein [Vibrio diabolicus]|uniref:GGDEF domain-containing protein n=1 Tax=Vibrio diabolicus TaxID=50719 RepID=UPI002495975B|nr:GGDEF domain-containing protein [Vibrio diabolicus]